MTRQSKNAWLLKHYAHISIYYVNLHAKRFRSLSFNLRKYLTLLGQDTPQKVMEILLVNLEPLPGNLKIIKTGEM